MEFAGKILTSVGILVLIWKGLPWLAQKVALSGRGISFRRRKIESVIISGGLGAFLGLVGLFAVLGTFGIKSVSGELALVCASLVGLRTARISWRTVRQAELIFS